METGNRAVAAGHGGEGKSARCSTERGFFLGQ